MKEIRCTADASCGGNYLSLLHYLRYGRLHLATWVVLLFFSVSANAMTDGELLKKVEDLSSTAKVKQLEIKRDIAGRVKINGEPFVDPEGPIDEFATFSSNGLFSYLVPTNEKMRTEGGKNFVIKIANPSANKSVQIGVANFSQLGVTVFTSTDEKINGNVLHQTSNGFVLVRKERDTDTAFIYEAGKGLTTLRFESSRKNPYRLFPQQVGDIFGTRKLLVYKEETTMGIFTTTTYSWFDIDTKKNVGEFGDGIGDVKSLLDQHYDGGKGLAKWFITPSGRSIGVGSHNGALAISAIDLATGKTYKLFSNALPFQGLSVSFDNYPKILVKTRLRISPNLTNYQVNDLDDFIANYKEVETKKDDPES